MFKKVLTLIAILQIASAAPSKSIDVTPANELFEIFRRLCVTMLPEHSDSPRQPGPFPVTIVMTPQGPYRPGQNVQVTLKGDPGFNFTGFLIQARAPGSTVPVGAWTPGATATVVGCADPQEDFSGNDTAAHQTGSIRNVQELVWTAPQSNVAINLNLELTTVERFGVFWMEQRTPTFSVAPASTVD